MFTESHITSDESDAKGIRDIKSLHVTQGATRHYTSHPFKISELRRQQRNNSRMAVLGGDATTTALYISPSNKQLRVRWFLLQRQQPQQQQQHASGPVAREKGRRDRQPSCIVHSSYRRVVFDGHLHVVDVGRTLIE